MFGVTILGNNSAVPAYDRHPTSQIVTVDNDLYMIDCGEGTQIQMMKYKVRRSKIKAIFISHLHGDHYFGLIGLLTSFGLMGRIQPLIVFSPGNLKEIINLQLKAGEVILPYELSFVEIQQEGILYNTNNVQISCFATQHRITCFGFKFEQKIGLRKLNIEKVKEFEIPLSYYNQLKEGKDYTTKQGQVIKNEWVTFSPAQPKSYAFCADTKYNEEMVAKVKNVDLLYHESTYLDSLRLKAIERFHSTSKQAAQFAKLAETRHLLIGHFSSKYENLKEFQREAREVFENTQLAKEGVTYLV